MNARHRRHAAAVLDERARIELDEPELDLPHLRPEPRHAESPNFVGGTPKPKASKPVAVGMTYLSKMAAVSSCWDSDKGAGVSRVPKGTPQPTGFTATGPRLSNKTLRTMEVNG